MVTAKAQTETILDVEALIKSFGGVTALMDVELHVPRGAIKAVIGPNGAGKTTLFNIITGALLPTEGQVKFNGRVISNLKAHEIAALGISRTFQTVDDRSGKCPGGTAFTLPLIVSGLRVAAA